MDYDQQQHALRRIHNLADHLIQDHSSFNKDDSENHHSLINISPCNGQQTTGPQHVQDDTLEEERKKASFDVRELMYVLDGSKEFTALKELVGRYDAFLFVGELVLILHSYSDHYKM